MFLWCDRNGDHIAQPDEIQYLVTKRTAPDGTPLRDMGLMPLVNTDLSITTSYGTWIAPPRIASNGALTYDVTKQRIVGNPEWQRSPLIAGDREISSQDGIDAMFGADLTGHHRWKYLYTPEEHPGGPGLMVAPTRFLGPPVKPAVGEAGGLVAIS